MAGGSQRQVDNALLDTQAMGGLAAHELAGTGNLKGGLLNLLGDFHHRCGIGQRLQGCGHNAGARNAYVDDGVGLATAVDGARHKRGVLDHVGKADKLGSADGILVGREFSGIDDGLGGHKHGVHIDAGAQAGDVDAGADAARGGEGLRNGLDNAAIGVADALLDERGEAAWVVDTEGLGRAVEGVRDGGEVLILAASGNLRHRGDGNALVDDGDTVLALEVLGGLDQMLSRVRHVVVDLRAHAVEVLVTATHERNTHGDGPDVEVLLLNHAAGFRDFCGRDRHPCAPICQNEHSFFYSNVPHVPSGACGTFWCSVVSLCYCPKTSSAIRALSAASLA